MHAQQSNTISLISPQKVCGFVCVPKSCLLLVTSNILNMNYSRALIQTFLQYQTLMKWFRRNLTSQTKLIHLKLNHDHFIKLKRFDLTNETQTYDDMQKQIYAHFCRYFNLPQSLLSQFFPLKLINFCYFHEKLFIKNHML